MTRVNVEMKVNGRAVRAEVPARRMLSDFLRDDLHLTGTKRGCETGTCGACSVLRDGVVVKSCLSLAVQSQGAEITTIEGLADQGGSLHPLQRAFMENGGLQCGYCTPGMIVTALDLLARNPRPTREEVRAGLSGNLCRCTGYEGIIDSILAAAEEMDGR